MGINPVFRETSARWSSAGSMLTLGLRRPGIGGPFAMLTLADRELIATYTFRPKTNVIIARPNNWCRM
jgi:hypothetical protein